MENLITQLQTALQEIVNERDTYKRQLEECERQSQRDAVSGNSQDDFIKGFKACIELVRENIGSGFTYLAHYSDYAYIQNLEVNLSGEVEVDGDDVMFHKAKLDLSDEDIIQIYNMLKAESDE